MPNSPDEIQLPLNSFVRRTQHTYELKALITSTGGKLTRKGRSRNWQLILPRENKKTLIDKIYQADEKSWLWVAKLLAQEKVSYEKEDLLEILKNSPSMTITELMSLTNCTASEARKALDNQEWSE